MTRERNSLGGLELQHHSTVPAVSRTQRVMISEDGGGGGGNLTFFFTAPKHSKWVLSENSPVVH